MPRGGAIPSVALHVGRARVVDEHYRLGADEAARPGQGRPVLNHEGAHVRQTVPQTVPQTVQAALVER